MNSNPHDPPFSRSYGCILPNSLTEVLPIALQFSCRPPVSVCGTGTKGSTLRSFSGQHGLTHFWPCGTAYGSGSGNGFAYPLHLPNRLEPTMSNRQAELSDCVTPSLPFRGTGIFTGYPSPTALALGLGPTNPTRITLASEPLDFRRRRFSRRFRYSSQHSHF
jgi:hypothetical protein